MARTKEFDPDEALDRAVDLFWRQGYEATSIADLVAHLGVSRASLYDTFGSKHELYLRALDRYVEARTAEDVATLAQPGPALPAVRALVERFASEAAGAMGARGCLAVNAACERVPVDSETTRRVERNWETLEVALTSALMRARAGGELVDDCDPRALARFLLVVLQGLRVLGRTDAEPARLTDATRTALTILG
jgi:TetR/AcrR family transcriptional regulator, transcriptional repressor for nem operon